MPASPPVAQGPPSLPLRAKLCDVLVDVPDLLSQASTLSDLDGSRSGDQADLEARCEHLLLRVTAMSRRLETWYVEELEPLLRACDSLSTASTKSTGPSRDTGNTSGDSYEYPELLLAVLDCISNTVLVKLEKVFSTLTLALPELHKDIGLATWPATIMRRQATVRVSLNFVRRNSKVAAKPLEFGLQQLWSADGAFGQRSLSDTCGGEAQ